MAELIKPQSKHQIALDVANISFIHISSLAHAACQLINDSDAWENNEGLMSAMTILRILREKALESADAADVASIVRS